MTQDYINGWNAYQQYQKEYQETQAISRWWGVGAIICTLFAGFFEILALEAFMSGLYFHGIAEVILGLCGFGAFGYLLKKMCEGPNKRVAELNERWQGNNPDL